MEVQLEVLLRLALNVENKTDPERIFQINLGRKIDQLKDVCRGCPALQPFENVVRGLSSIIKNWGHDRDFLIHSILVGFEDGPPPKIILRHVQHPKGLMIKCSRGEFGLVEINDFTDRTKKLHRVLFPLIKDMIELQDPQRLEKARSQVDRADPKKPPIQL